METNILYYGDNLDIMHKHIPDNSIDLIYIDPPFFSSKAYEEIARCRQQDNINIELINIMEMMASESPPSFL